MFIDIVSNKKRQIIENNDYKFIYIPMSKIESDKFSKNIINPCWRIRISKNDDMFKKESK